MRLPVLILFLLASASGWAHIGSPAVFYEGQAGPYQVRVHIRPPEVVPGRAQIDVRVRNGPVAKVSALPVRWDAGRKGAPPPDPAPPVPGEPGLFSTELWLMDFGAYSVFVDVAGPRGQGTAIVPLNSVSTRRLPMSRWMAAAFLSCGALLLLLLVALIGAAVRESVLGAGSSPDPVRVRRGRYAMAGAVLLIALVLHRGHAWWGQVDSDFRNNRLFKPSEIASAVQTRPAGAFLHLNLEGAERDLRDHTPLVADHGRLMHLFLVKEPAMDAFAHLHPAPAAPGRFEAPLPALPPGSYSLYADVTHESGLTQTLLSRLELASASPAPVSPDPDDSAWAGAAAASTDAAIQDGCVVRMLSPAAVRAGQETTLRFDVLAADGKPAPLEPYLGMWSHAVVRSGDASVYTHLHPAGTISMASQELFARRERGEDLRKPIDILCGRPERELLFPWSFPKAGRYRVWVQVKIAGRIQTAAFDLEALPGGA